MSKARKGKKSIRRKHKRIHTTGRKDQRFSKAQQFARACPRCGAAEQLTGYGSHCWFCGFWIRE